jgi:hypothetical protein
MKKVVSKLVNIYFTALFITLIGFSTSKSQTVYDTLNLFPDTTTFLNESIYIGGWTDNFAVRFDADSTWYDYRIEKILFQVPSGIIPNLTSEIVVSLGDLPEDSIISTINVLYDTIPLYPYIATQRLDSPIVINSSNHFFISGFTFFMTLTLGPAVFPIPDQFHRFSGNGNWSEGLGSYFYLKVVVKKIVTDIKPETQLLSTFSLSQNYPNPFNPSTNIQYAISSRQFVTLKVFDVLGKEVATLVNEEKPAGMYNVEFRMQNLDLSSGIYFYQLKSGEYIETKKMILMK